MKIYLAGKITGDENYREKFRKQEERLREEGHIVLNPASLPDGLRSEEYMQICSAMMGVADCVGFLPGWEDSPGAQLEYAWCKYVGKPMMWLRGGRMKRESSAYQHPPEVGGEDCQRREDLRGAEDETEAENAF